MNELVGAWRLLAQTVRLSNGSEHPARGTEPRGLLLYEANGWMAVQLASRAPAGDLAALATALEAYVGYFGRYTVDWAAQTVTHHIESCSYAPWIGTAKLRHFHLSENRLTLSAEQPVDGTLQTRVLVWERVPESNEVDR